MESEEVEQIIYEENHESKINVIPVQLIEINRNEEVIVSSPSPTNSSNIVRGKYYKQTYRPAWEQMPDFKGWLKGVEGEPTRAYCTYCQKTLHAHRLSLLKHTCTIRHQKAAQVHNARKNKSQTSKMLEPQELQVSIVNEGSLQQGDTEDGEIHPLDCSEMGDEDEHDADLDHEDDEEENEAGLMEFHNNPFQKQFEQQQQNSSPKPPISTHVIDTTRGTPVTGLSVSLYKLIDGRWTYINEGLTNSSGRFAQFLDRADFTPGRYKLHYDVDRYFEARKQESLYPFIEIVFDSSLYSENYHIPMLLSPFGYTTYRGS